MVKQDEKVVKKKQKKIKLETDDLSEVKSLLLHPSKFEVKKKYS